MPPSRLEPQPAKRQHPAARRRVLVVDDEPRLVAVLRALLEEEGYAVLTASSGAAALQIARDDTVDLVVTDFMMPSMNGGELIRALHAADLHAPVLVMSSLDEHVIARACVGHSGFFRKPFDVPEFLRTVAMLVHENPHSGAREHLRLVR